MLQGIHESSSTQNYPVGMRYAIDERVFRYCLAADVALAGNLAAFWGWSNRNLVAVNHVVLPQVTVVGSTTVVITDATATLNEYRNGWLFIHRAAGYQNQGYRIRGNTASVGGLVTLSLYEAIIVASSVGCSVYVHRNIYDNVGYPGVTLPIGYETIVCVPWLAPVRNEYFWGQTWGPCWGFYSSIEPGATLYTREVDFLPNNGSLILHSQVAGYGLNISAQRAGYILPRTEAGDGNCFYMLQLSP